ncbi:MAG: hypothetical protein E3J72_08085 [Planctomycetota bacterium]|nr:MAG: hypothetical protein E3J72_08085 [Planctomycetota bacterium]
MANYSTDSEMVKVDIDINQWLGSRQNFDDVRNLVTARINAFIKKRGLWPLLETAGVIDQNDLVDKTKILNPEDLADLENTWVREILYFDNIATSDRSDPVTSKAFDLRKQRLSMLRHLTIIVDADGDGNPEREFPVYKLHRG